MGSYFQHSSHSNPYSVTRTNDQGIFNKIIDSLSLYEGNYVRNLAIFEAKTEIRRAYQLPGKNTIDFAMERFRDAYCLLYLASHINLTRSILILATRENPNLFLQWLSGVVRKGILEICSIGGGPGSDILGVMLFLKELNLRGVQVNCIVYDLYKEWEHSFQSIYNRHRAFFAGGNSFTVQYVKYNFVQKIDGGMRKNLLKADLITFIKSVSAFPLIRNFQENIQDLFNQVSPGTIVIYVDNPKSICHNRMQQAANLNQLDVLYNQTDVRMELEIVDKQAIHKFNLLPDRDTGRSQCGVNIFCSVWITRQQEKSALMAQYQERHGSIRQPVRNGLVVQKESKGSISGQPIQGRSSLVVHKGSSGSGQAIQGRSSLVSQQIRSSTNGQPARSSVTSQQHERNGSISQTIRGRNSLTSQLERSSTRRQPVGNCVVVQQDRNYRIGQPVRSGGQPAVRHSLRGQETANSPLSSFFLCIFSCCFPCCSAPKN